MNKLFYISSVKTYFRAIVTGYGSNLVRPTRKKNLPEQGYAYGNGVEIKTTKLQRPPIH